MKKLTTSLLSWIALTATSALAGVSLDDPQPVSLSESVTSSAPLLGKGTQEFTISGEFDWDGFDDFDYNFRLGYGWFIADGWEFGVTGSALDENDSRNYSAGLFTEYNFNRTSNIVPFIGLSAEWANLDVSFEDFNIGKDSILLGAQVGVKYFFRPNIALSTALTYSWATDDIFNSVDDFDESRSSFLVGLRVYF